MAKTAGKVVDGASTDPYKYNDPDYEDNSKEKYEDPDFDKAWEEDDEDIGEDDEEWEEV